MKPSKAVKTLTFMTAYSLFRRFVIYSLMLNYPVQTFVVMAFPLDIGLLKKTHGDEGKRTTNERQK